MRTLPKYYLYSLNLKYC
jgi:hypothetical protein